MFIVEVEGLYFSYDGKNYVLENVSFEVKRGEFIGILGPNGSGKTTLLKILAGLLKPSRGRVLVRTKSIGYVPQKIEVESLFPATVEEIIHSAERLREDIAELLHIKHLFKKQFVKLSGGEQQRVLLYLALSSEPELVLLDEPTSALDVHTKKHIVDILKKLYNEGKTIITVSHDINMLYNLSDRILCLNRSVYFFGEPEKAREEIAELFGFVGV